MKIKLSEVFSNPSLFLVTGFGIGLLPIAPGTFGSMLGIILFLILVYLNLPIFWISLIILIFCFFSYLAIRSTLETIKRSDPGEIVIDEVLGMMFVMMTIPPDPKWIFLAFILFRIFDILMPWPINRVDSQLKNALGVMLDDFIAALYAGIIIMVIRFFL
jgi:phosphatidylglycerophosphatase A|tara:strand:+ start:305 stop:784 length:480 start_codon:yes stop_codon:yes gene_type:complete